MVEKVEYDESKGLAQGWNGIEKSMKAGETGVSLSETGATYGDLTQAATAFVKLKLEQAELKAKVAVIEGKLEAITEPLTEFMVEGGVASLKIAGMTVYLHSQMWGGLAEGASKDDATAALKGFADTSFLVKESYNAQTLASWLRELPKEAEGDRLGEAILPTELAPFIRSNTITKPRARKC